MLSKSEIAAIERRIGYTFSDKQLLDQAFVHSSLAKRKNISDNERMEFFGDAVLEYLSSEYLFDKYTESDAGQLSAMRSHVVSADALRPVVLKMDILQYLQVANGAGKIKKISRKIEANLYEAILCAIYLDGGIDSARKFVLSTLEQTMVNAGNIFVKDSKTLLQEYCQKNKLSIEYRFVDKSGPDNDPEFKYELLIDGKRVAEGSGQSIKAAEQDAAHKIVVKWRID